MVVVPVKLLFALKVRVPPSVLVKVPLPVAMLELMVVLPVPPIVRLVLLPPIAPAIASVPPVFTLKVVAPPNVIAVSLSPSELLPPSTRLPFKVMPEGATAVKPLL